MDNKINEIIILSEEEVFKDKRIDILKEVGLECPVTDFAILLGAAVIDCNNKEKDSSLKSRTSWWCTIPKEKTPLINCVTEDGNLGSTMYFERTNGIRPVLVYSNFSFNKKKKISDNLFEVEYGEYPQYAVDKSLGKTLEKKYQTGSLKKTGKTYTVNSGKWWGVEEDEFIPIQLEEYEYQEKRYVRATYSNHFSCVLSNNQEYDEDNVVWVEISPLKWILDEKEKILVSEKILISGLLFWKVREEYKDFKNTEIYMFLNKFFINDIYSKKYEKRHEKVNGKRKGIKVKDINVERIQEIITDNKIDLKKDNEKKRPKVKIK